MATKLTSLTPTRSARRAAAEAHISDEVLWYLESRGIPVPDCPPLWRTPEPNRVKGAIFDPDRVDRVMRAMGAMKHAQGKWRGRPLKPDPWQVAYILAPVFGWVRRDDEGRWVRVIQLLYVDVPRKNGKTTIAGGLALYLTGGDGEGGSQVVAVAAAKSQASFCFDPVKEIVDGTPGLKRNFRPMRGQILHPRSGSKFSVASSIGELLQGSNPHGAIVDELHVHKTPDVLDAVTSGQGARSQPLTVIITTPDDGRSGTVYDRERRKAEKLAAGVLKDESVYAVLWGAELDDDPFSEATWRKANPGYGVSPSKAFMEREARKAKNSPAELAGFQRLNLGIRTKQQERFIKLPTWDRNAGMVVEDRLAGMKCHGGLDLSSVSDLTALAWVFRDDKTGARTVLLRHWLPEDRLDDLNRRTANAASVWVKEGWLRLTPGEVVDYAFVRHQINEDRARFDAQTIAFDRWNASQLVQELLDDGADMVEMGQGFASMSTPTKELQRLLLQGTSKNPMVVHGANPLLRWEIDNLAVRTDPAGNVKPDKARSGEKIDGVVALVMALDQDLRHTEITPFGGELEVI